MNSQLPSPFSGSAPSSVGLQNSSKGAGVSGFVFLSQPQFESPRRMQPYSQMGGQFNTRVGGPIRPQRFQQRNDSNNYHNGRGLRHFSTPNGNGLRDNRGSPYHRGSPRGGYGSPSHNGSFNGSHNGSHNGNFNSGHNSSFNGSFNSSHNGSFSGSHNGSFNGGHNGSFNGGHNGSFSSSHNGSFHNGSFNESPFQPKLHTRPANRSFQSPYNSPKSSHCPSSPFQSPVTGRNTRGGRGRGRGQNSGPLSNIPIEKFVSNSLFEDPWASVISGKLQEKSNLIGEYDRHFSSDFDSVKMLVSDKFSNQSLGCSSESEEMDARPSDKFDESWQ